jgi:anti-sigma regulatory factor (Ser/Thr protein kinase)
VETRTKVANGASAPAEARRFVASLSDRIPQPVLEDVLVVTSELVTNSYKHAGNPEGFPIEVAVDLTEDRVRLEVVDHSVLDPTPETADERQDVKLELALVDRIADAWGRVEGGVWVEFQQGREWSAHPRGT